jgi:hypothetical protein
VEQMHQKLFTDDVRKGENKVQILLTSHF